MKVLVVLYNPIDLFPPTINAVEQLSKSYSSVTVLTSCISNIKKWKFQQNVSSYYINQWLSVADKKSFGSKISDFLKFSFKLLRLLASQKFDVVVLYEQYAVLAYSVAIRLVKHRPRVLWYHNHDVVEMDKLSKHSLLWYAAKMEKKFFKEYSVFSLPANERKVYFPLEQLKGKYFFIPNYPSVNLYQPFYQKKIITDELKLVYQGRISEGHGLEELISLLPQKIAGKWLTLHLKGPSDPIYVNTLKHLAYTHDVSEQLFFYGMSSYSEVPKLTSSCHIGIGIHTQNAIMHNTLGTSSNKIYEYAAAGLPVLLYDNVHFKEHLQCYEWAFFTNCSKESLIDCIEQIIIDYTNLSAQAHSEFIKNLNFEKYFNNVIKYVSEKILK